MDEKHQDKTESKSIVAEDVKWVLNRRSKLWVPKRRKWTGFENKTRWDRLQLLTQVVGAFAIPLSIIALIIGVWQFNIQQKNDSQNTANQQKTEFQNLKDQQQQTTLETYLDRMSDLLFTQHLNTSKPEDEVRQVARARTLAALQNLNPARKGVLLQFLYESDLIFEPSDTPPGNTNNPIIDLTEADLSGANLSHATLSSAELRFTDLSGADLHDAVLKVTDLYGDILDGANLNYTYLIDADLSGADLSGARITEEQLKEAKSLKGATMPDGSIHP